TYKLNEVAKYIVEPGLGQQTAVVMMNLDVWRSLTDKQQAVFKELEPMYRRKIARANIKELRHVRQNIDDLTDHPIEIYQLNDEQRSVWKKAIKQTQEQIFVDNVAERNPAAHKIHKLYMKALRKVEKRVDQQGYPWQTD